MSYGFGYSLKDVPYATRSLASKVAAILRKFGSNAHVWMPGVGVLNGFQAANYLEANASGAPQVVDQPVGYVGDAANLTLGANIVGNSTFDDLTGWNAIGTGGSSQIVSGELELTGSGGAYPGRRITVTTVVGKAYQVTATARRGTTASAAAVTVLGAALSFTGTSNETKTQIFTATGTSTNIDCSISSATATGTAYFDDIIVREITGAIPATQATTANKPILRCGHVNRIRNSTMQGAVVGTPGTAPTNWNYFTSNGINRAIVGKGTINGLEYIDVRFWGTATAGTDTVIDPELSNGVAGITGQTWTFSVKCALVGGAWPSRVVDLRISERNSAQSSLAVSTLDIRSLVTGSELVSVSLTRAFNQATTVYASPGIRCPLQTGDSCDFTIRIAAPQLETGSVANSYVPTTTAAKSAETGGYWWEFGMEATPNDTLTIQAAPVFTNTDDHCVVSAARVENGTGNCTVFSQRASAGTAVCAQLAFYAGVPRATWISDDNANNASLVHSVSVAGQAVVLAAHKTGSTESLRVNGAVSASGSVSLTSTVTLNAASIGVIPLAAPVNYMVGSVFGAIAIKGTVTDADLKILEKWVGQQAGVTIT